MEDKERSANRALKALQRFRRKDLAAFVDIVLEVVVFGDDGFGDEWMVGDADGGNQRGSICLSQPRNFCGLLVVLVIQVQTSPHRRDLPIRPSEEAQGEGIVNQNKGQHLFGSTEE